MQRLIAIGDIHGQLDKLIDLIEQIRPTEQDQLVFLGDFMDRGPASKGVIDYLISIQKQYPQTIFLRGNHEQLFLDFLVEVGVRNDKTLKDQSRDWAWETRNLWDCDLFLQNGGSTTLHSYNVVINLCWPKKVELVSGEFPKEHIEFIERTKTIYKHGNFIFVHASYAGDKEDDLYFLLWERYREHPPEGKKVVLGHTQPPDGSEQPWISPGTVYMDTGAAYGKPLSGMDLLSGKVWQAVGDTSEADKRFKTVGKITDLPTEDREPFENYLIGKNRPSETEYWRVDYQRWKTKKS